MCVWQEMRVKLGTIVMQCGFSTPSSSGRRQAMGTNMGMQDVLAALKAAGEATRLRLLFILSRGEFNVTELTQILGQSQPRLSRHLKLMVEAGLLERHREGSWVIFRLREDGAEGELARMIAGRLDEHDPTFAADLAKVNAILAQRRERAAAYFAAVAEEWDRIRSLHVAEDAVEKAMCVLAGEGPFRLLLDIGTGTGRMLEMFAPFAEEAIGIDSSREMLAVARGRLAKPEFAHVKLRLADATTLPVGEGVADLITMHQVLHYLEDPGAVIREAARVLADGGRLLVADFAPHELEFLREECAHRRLGISERDMRRWLERAGLHLLEEKRLEPPAALGERGLTVSLWLAGKGDA